MADVEYRVALLRAKAGLCRLCGRKLGPKKVFLFLLLDDAECWLCGPRCLARYNGGDDVKGTPDALQPEGNPEVSGRGIVGASGHDDSTSGPTPDRASPAPKSAPPAPGQGPSPVALALPFDLPSPPPQAPSPEAPKAKRTPQGTPSIEDLF